MAEMPCDWTRCYPGAGDARPNSPTRGARRAVSKVRSLLFGGRQSRLFASLKRTDSETMARDACRAVEVNGSDEEDVPVIDDLCSHLDQAIVDGLFDTIPNE